MRERGDLDVLHEPFMYDFYLNQPAYICPDFTPQAGHPQTFEDIRDMILKRAMKQPVFFKDMAYYVADSLPKDTGFLTRMSHCFLVRDPAESILSYYRRDPGFTLFEVGIEAQYRLYHTLRDAGAEPLVITADDLRTNPRETLGRYWAHVGLCDIPNAFEWDSKMPEGWGAVKNWHATVLSSGAIHKPASGRDYPDELAQLGAPFTEYDTHHRPFYQMLFDIAAHQK